MLRFGTDGVRGDAAADLTSPLVVALGRAVARVLRSDRVLIGRDPRASGARIFGDLALGLTREGVVPVDLGVLPTPAIAFAAAQEALPAAIVSASHNPWTDNGVKVVGADGRKLRDDVEAAIEHELRALVDAPPGVVGEASDALEASLAESLPVADAYVDHLLGALAGRRLDGMRIALDCANGATFEVGPRVFRAAGADVRVLHAAPDGRNINESCGSTHPSSLQAAVGEHAATLGLALDGDGDRVIAVDEGGNVVDGDEIMTMIALDLHERGALPGDAVAVTVMSNLGLRRALDRAGIGVVETPVGDRHVVAAMQAHGLALGGEQSGHIVFAAHATTGDGLLTGLLLGDLVARARAPLSALAAQMVRVPQILVNVRVARRVELDESADLVAAVREAEARLGAGGRVLVRPSGTEPLVRVMVEADAQSAAEDTAATLRDVVEREFGLA
ncbi:MAG TPA: phosphoglucosamine mutase [Acidimicrobiia bacterium]|nr:phosphoglucosamine mutase [Acidimicrobiia bacterium]